MQRKILIVLFALSLTGCIAQSRIQARYIDAQNECRKQAEERVPAADTTTNANGAPEDLSGALARQFSDCMNKAGWHVSAPKTSATPAAQVVPTTAPGAPSTPPTKPVAPAPVAPQPAPAVAPAPATYEPGRPGDASDDSNYGSGAGRQF